MSDGLKQAVQRKGSFLQTMRAVAWSFFGVRKSRDYEQDVAQLNPVHVIIAGLVAAGVFIALLLLLIRWATDVVEELLAEVGRRRDELAAIGMVLAAMVVQFAMLLVNWIIASGVAK